MRELIIARPDNNIDLQLYSVERVLPLVLRYYKQSPPLTELVEATGECLQEIGRNYGCQYLALIPIERDGMGYLPLHCRRVLSVQPGPAGLDYASGSSPWSPNETWGHRQYVADQIGDFTCWRRPELEALRWGNNVQLQFRRVEAGIHLPQYVQPRENSGFIRHVVVVYEAQLTDERGWPLLSQIDAAGAAHYWNWQRIQGDAFNNVKSALQLLPLAEQNKDLALSKMRIGEGISEAGWDLILRSGASWDRTSYRYGLHFPPAPGLAYGRGQSGVADGY